MYFRLIFCVLAGLGVSACIGNTKEPSPKDFLAQHNIPTPKLTALVYCTEHGCQSRKVLTFTSAQWQSITSAFKRPANSAQEEREKLSIAISEFEKIGGAYTGTEHDQARTSFVNADQLDCIDETINTLSLIMVLEGENILRYHVIGNPAGRGGLFDWPHYASTIVEKKSGKQFVVDSWMYGNGKPATILPLPVWQAGWNPE